MEASPSGELGSVCVVRFDSNHFSPKDSSPLAQGGYPELLGPGVARNDQHLPLCAARGQRDLALLGPKKGLVRITTGRRVF